VYRPQRLDDDDPDPARRAQIAHDTGAGDVPSRFGISAAQTADPARRAIEDEVWRSAGVAGGRLFDRYAIQWAVLPDSVAQTLRLPAAARHGRWSLVDVHPARPRAFVAPRWRSAPDPSAAVRAVFPTTAGGGSRPPCAMTEGAAGCGGAAFGAELDTIVLVGEGDGGPGERAPVPACAVANPSSAEVRMTCDSDGGWAVLLDAWAPGWSVTVDGAPSRAVIADALVRATRLAPGRHVVVWRYASPGLATGAAVSLAAMLLVAGTGLAASRAVRWGWS
jgi:hypothetical protein